MIRAKYGLVGAALAVASVMSGSCADYSGILIIHNQAVPESCQTAPNIGDPYLPHGFAPIGDGGGGYFLTPLLQSALVNREATMNGDIVELETAVVEIEPVDSAESRAVVAALKELRGRTRYISGSVAPRGLTSIGFPGIDNDQAAAMASVMMDGQAVEVLLEVIVYGNTAGTKVSSQPFLYPVTVAKVAPFTNLGPCANIPVGTVGSDTDCFGTGQDGGNVQCCTSDTGAAVCPAVGAGAVTP